MLNFLPKGKGTYIMVGVGVAAIWTVYALTATGVWTGAPELLVKACASFVPAAPAPGSDQEILAAACATLKEGAFTVGRAVAATWAALTVAFVRRAIA